MKIIVGGWVVTWYAFCHTAYMTCDAVCGSSYCFFNTHRSNFPKTQRSIGRVKPACKNQLDPCSRFDTVPACDERTLTDRRTHNDG